jgi:ribosome-associated protein
MDGKTESTLNQNSEALARRCVDICVGRKAEDVMLFDVRESSILADYYLICTGTSAPHINAICGHLRQDLAKDGVLPRAREGDPASHWVVMDYGSVLVHVLDPDRRRFYRIEDLWESGHLVAQPAAEPLVAVEAAMP